LGKVENPSRSTARKTELLRGKRMPEKAKVMGNAVNRGSKFALHRKVANFWWVFSDKSK